MPSLLRPWETFPSLLGRILFEYSVNRLPPLLFFEPLARNPSSVEFRAQSNTQKRFIRTKTGYAVSAILRWLFGNKSNSSQISIIPTSSIVVPVK